MAKPTIPDPCENRGWTRNNGNLEPLWFLERGLVPEAMVELLIDTVNADSASPESDEEEEPYLDYLYMTAINLKNLKMILSCFIFINFAKK